MRSWPGSEADRALAVVTLSGSAVIAIMALMMFARSATARRVLLAITVLVATSHIGSLAAVDSNDLQSGHAMAAMAAILMLVALSSPTATEWTTPSPATSGH